MVLMINVNIIVADSDLSVSGGREFLIIQVQVLVTMSFSLQRVKWLNTLE